MSGRYLLRGDNPALALDRLAAGGAIDVQQRRRNPWPERAMRWLWVGFWSVLGFAIAASIWSAL